MIGRVSSAKGQVLWKPASTFEARVIIGGERARDGDYALSDLGGLRTNPFQAARDFEGFTERDIFSTTVLTRWDASTRVALDRHRHRRLAHRGRDGSRLHAVSARHPQQQRRESAVHAGGSRRLVCGGADPSRHDRRRSAWQAGALFFTQNYDQDASNTYSPLLLSSSSESRSRFSVVEQSPLAELDDVGIGVYGHGTVTLADKLDLIAGVRADHEQKSATAADVHDAATGTADVCSIAKRAFSDVSPAVRGRVSREAESIAYTGSSRVATRRAASTRRRQPATRPTIRSTRGASRAA